MKRTGILLVIVLTVSAIFAQPQKHGHMHARLWQDSVVRQKIKNYVKQNVAPVVLAEQKAFETNLSKKEVKKIEEARQLVKQRKEEFWENRMQVKEGNKPEVNDSLMLAKKLEMQQAMIPVTEIALKHYSELEQHLEKIREQMPQWRKDIREITGKDKMREVGRMGKKHMFKKMFRFNSPVAFLLFSEDLLQR